MMNSSQQPDRSVSNSTKIITNLSIGVIALCSGNLYAKDDSQSTPWNIGINTTYRQSPFVDGKGVVGFSPTRLKYGNIRLQGFALPLYRNADFVPYVAIGLDEWDYKRGDSATLQDMSKLNRAINIRAGVAMPLHNAQLTTEVGKDVAGAHNGVQAKIRYSRYTKFGNGEVRPYLEAQWLSSDLTDYYVGVNSDEVNQNRPQYSADADIALKVGVNYLQRLSQAFTLIGGVNLTQYGNEISDSPIVEKDLIWGANLGITYRWK